ncbi:hypothetical protein, partial [Shigella sonnei]|uniref:hypothetical protein n=1 Tax=Shigella sonnei TaxID=624 RepID=UPI001C0A782D
LRLGGSMLMQGLISAEQLAQKKNYAVLPLRLERQSHRALSEHKTPSISWSHYRTTRYSTA